MVRRSFHKWRAPVDVIKKQLLASNRAENKVKEILSTGYDVIIISKGESYKLTENKLYKRGSADERLEAIGATLVSDVIKRRLISQLEKLK